jgi:hypothetical protein
MVHNAVGQPDESCADQDSPASAAAMDGITAWAADDPAAEQ